MQYLTALIAFVIGLAPGIYVARKGQIWVAGLFAIGASGVAIWALLESGGSATAGGSPVFGVVAFLMLAPVVLGLVVGSGVGLYLRAKAGQRTPHDDTPS